MEWTEEKTKKIYTELEKKYVEVLTLVCPDDDYWNYAVQYAHAAAVLDKWSQYLEAIGIEQVPMPLFDSAEEMIAKSVPPGSRHVFVVNPLVYGRLRNFLKIPIDTAERILILGL